MYGYILKREKTGRWWKKRHSHDRLGAKSFQYACYESGTGKTFHLHRVWQQWGVERIIRSGQSWEEINSGTRNGGDFNEPRCTDIRFPLAACPTTFWIILYATTFQTSYNTILNKTFWNKWLPFHVLCIT